MEVPALKEASINQAPRLAFTPEGDLVKDIKYQRGVDGLVEGAKVVVVKVLEQNQKRRKVVSQEKGVITRVHNNNNVQVDFGKDGSKEEITVPISSLSVVVQSGKKPKYDAKQLLEEQADAEAEADAAAAASLSPSTSPTLIKWVRTTDSEAEQHLVDTIRSALWHFYLCFCPTEEEIGFESAGAAPILLQEAPPNTIKLVPYSPNISLRPPVDVFCIPITCVVKGKPYRKAYIVHPRVAPQADSRVPEGEGASDEINPFWNAVQTAAGEPNLVADSITTAFGNTATVKQEGYKGLKSPMKIEIIFPILTNRDVIENGNLLRGPSTVLVRLPAASGPAASGGANAD